MSRYLDMAISVRLADVDGEGRWLPATDRQLIRIGGVWDRRKKRWAPRRKARRLLVLRLHRGQERAGRWLCDWLRRFAGGDWEGVQRMWSALLIGGRRSGKTHVACLAEVLFAAMVPRSLLWVVSPTIETGDEIDETLRSLLPRHWYVRKQAKTGRATTFRLANGSRILLKSGMKAERLKAGRVDIALINEAQEQTAKGYAKLRAPIADRGGLVLLTANPPDRPSGRWVEDHFNRANAGEIDAIAFELDPRNNPLINYDALASIAQEVDAETYDRDVLGLFPPIGDVVFTSWTDRENWIDRPARLVDVTAEVTRRELGRPFPHVIGCDFQTYPAMCARIARIFRDPDDATNTELLWWEDELDTAAGADEYELIDALEAKGYDGATSAVIMDASGFTQDGQHSPRHLGKTSERAFRARGWLHLYMPQKDSAANPDVVERMKSGNALLASKSGRRRMFVARRCVLTAEGMRRYELKHGRPNRKSDYAHGVDCVTYVTYRLFGRPMLVATETKYTAVKRYSRGDDLRAGF